MGTYTANFTTWLRQFNFITSKVKNDKLGIGLDTLNEQTGKFIPVDDVKMRFDYIIKNNIMEVDIWKTPIPVYWWSELKRYQESN